MHDAWLLQCLANASRGTHIFTHLSSSFRHTHAHLGCSLTTDTPLLSHPTSKKRGTTLGTEKAATCWLFFLSAAPHAESHSDTPLFEGEKPTTHTEGTGGGERKGLCECFCAHMYDRRVWQRRGWREEEAIVAWGKTNTQSFPPSRSGSAYMYKSALLVPVWIAVVSI